MKAIVAMSENRAIGKNNKLPWPSIKEDFQWFKEFTLNKILVAGKNTYWGLPDLPKRKILVLTRTMDKKVGDNFWNPLIDLAVCHADFETILEIDVTSKGELIVAGGAKTYELFLPYITEFYVTHIKGEYEADTFMPPFEHLFTKQEVVKEFDGHRVIKYSVAE